jgi:hypothetical protein
VSSNNGLDLWETLLWMFPTPVSYEVDCLHLLLSIVWFDPAEVWVCDACGAVFSTDETLMEQEMIRPFVEALL